LQKPLKPAKKPTTTSWPAYSILQSRVYYLKHSRSVAKTHLQVLSAFAILHHLPTIRRAYPRKPRHIALNGIKLDPAIYGLLYYAILFSSSTLRVISSGANKQFVLGYSSPRTSLLVRGTILGDTVLLACIVISILPKV
jgi:hypothetical protein